LNVRRPSSGAGRRGASLCVIVVLVIVFVFFDVVTASDVVASTSTDAARFVAVVVVIARVSIAVAVSRRGARDRPASAVAAECPNAVLVWANSGDELEGVARRHSASDPRRALGGAIGAHRVREPSRGEGVVLVVASSSSSRRRRD